MHGDAGGSLAHIALADAPGNVFAVEQHTIAADGAIERDPRILRQFQEHIFVVERGVAFDGAQSQRPVHRTTLQIHVAEFAGEAGGDRALAGSGWAVNGDDEFARGRVGHWGRCHWGEGRLYTERWSAFTTGYTEVHRGNLEDWNRPQNQYCASSPAAAAAWERRPASVELPAAATCCRRARSSIRALTTGHG